MQTRLIISALALATIGAFTLPSAQALDLYWRTDGTPGGTWSSTFWNPGSANPTGGTGWTAAADAFFTANSTLTFATNTVGNVSLSGGVAVTVTQAGTLTLGGVRTFDIGNGSTLTWQNQTMTANSADGITKNGAGTLDLGALTWTTNMTGGFTLNNGTVIVSGNKALGNGALTLNGGTLQSSGTRAFAPTSLTIGGDFAFAGTGNANWDAATTLALGASTRTITNNTTSGSRQLRGLISGGSGAGLTFAGTGAGQLYIGNTGNTFDGPIAINGGEVVFNGNGAFGASTSITIDGGRLTMASMDTSGNTSALTSATIASSRNIFAGASAGTSISVQGATGVTTYNGVIADKPSATGAWAKQGAGRLELGGVSTYTGDTAINNGTVRLITGDNRLPTGTAVSLGQSASANLGTFDLNGFNQQIAGLISTTGTNATTNNNTVTSTAAATLTLGGSGTYSYGDGTNTNSGVITGAISLVKNGSGTQTLGDTNTYTGTTTVGAGKLVVAGSISASSLTTVNGTGTLSGSGTVGALKIDSGGTLSPGNSPGQLNAGNTQFLSSGVYKFELNSDGTGSAGTNWDRLAITGNLDISSLTAGSPFILKLQTQTGSNVDGLLGSWNPNVDHTWAGIVTTTTGFTGTFAANEFSVDTTGFQNAINGTFSVALNGNNLDLQYSAVPEPSTWAMVLGGFGALALVQRARRHQR
jgi:fibronectin-binding autotransporter adhesin